MSIVSAYNSYKEWWIKYQIPYGREPRLSEEEEFDIHINDMSITEFMFAIEVGENLNTP